MKIYQYLAPQLQFKYTSLWHFCVVSQRNIFLFAVYGMFVHEQIKPVCFVKLSQVALYETWSHCHVTLTSCRWRVSLSYDCYLWRVVFIRNNERGFHELCNAIQLYWRIFYWIPRPNIFGNVSERNIQIHKHEAVAIITSCTSWSRPHASFTS